jgi:cation diffusion facilitator family transporter
VAAAINTEHEQAPEERSPRSYVVLSIAAAVITIALKLTAFLLTDSVGLFSDAAESVINLIAALAAFWALTVAVRPPDEEHAYGHTKAEYFSSGLEGGLILVAAGAIAMTAVERFLHPQPLENVGIGVGVSVVASAINGGVALTLMRAGQRLRSITLRADGYHLLTDVWTSAGVVVGVVLVQFTGLLWLDPMVALLVALNIAWTSFRLIRETAHGLLDTALPADDQRIIRDVLAQYEREGIHFHALRTRVSGQRRFVSMHVLVPGIWTIHDGHELCERIEHDIRSRLPKITVFTHLEPVEDPRSMADQELDRLTVHQ